MKTIEERAIEIYPTMESPNWKYENEIYRPLFEEWCKEQLKIDLEVLRPIMEENILKAIDNQKKIDIEKAELNFCIFCSCYDNCDARYSCETFEKFRKAMEE